MTACLVFVRLSSGRVVAWGGKGQVMLAAPVGDVALN